MRKISVYMLGSCVQVFGMRYYLPSETKRTRKLYLSPNILKRGMQSPKDIIVMVFYLITYIYYGFSSNSVVS